MKNYTGKKLSDRLKKALHMLEEATAEMGILSDEIVTLYPLDEDKNNSNGVQDG